MVKVFSRTATGFFAFDSQASPLIVGEASAFLAVGFLEDLVLSPQVFDDLLLLAVDLAGEDEKQKLPRL